MRCRSIGRCLFAFMLLCSALSLVGVFDRAFFPVYASIALPAGVLIAIARFRPQATRRHVTALSYATSALLLGFGVTASAADSTMVATAMPALLVLVAATFTDRYFRALGFMGIFAALLAVLSLTQKAPALAAGDVTNMATFFLVASAIHYGTGHRAIESALVTLKYEESQQTLTVESTFDHLTGLINRRRFFEIANSLGNGAQGEMAMGIIDIDDFKGINDAYGHQAGDEAISDVARVLMGTLSIDVGDPSTYSDRLRNGNDNFAGRLGGDEFVFLVRQKTSYDELRGMMEQMRQDVRNLPADGRCALTISTGIVRFAAANTSIDQAYHDADVALYRAKRGGKNQFSIYEPEDGTTKTRAES
ncbi:MAG: GGDEF domain-containing protein [Olsenella sp.]|nr:GGDEF domain-containing protein [Olsenella sp.]